MSYRIPEGATHEWVTPLAVTWAKRSYPGWSAWIDGEWLWVGDELRGLIELIVRDSAVADAGQWLFMNRNTIGSDWLNRTQADDVIYIAEKCKRIDAAKALRESPWSYRDAPKDVNLLVELESGAHEIAAHVEQPSMQPGTGLGGHKWFTKCGRQLMTVKRWMRIPE